MSKFSRFPLCLARAYEEGLLGLAPCVCMPWCRHSKLGTADLDIKVAARNVSRQP